MSELRASKVIEDFTRANGNPVLSRQQLESIADKGELMLPGGRLIQASPELKDAAKTALANDASLYKRLETARVSGEDNKLGVKDFGAGWRAVVRDSLETFKTFQKNVLGSEILSKDQVKDTAENGHVRTSKGEFTVPDDVRRAAMNMMENDGWLFEQAEASSHGPGDDGILSVADLEDKIAEVRMDQQNNNDDAAKR